MAVSLLIVRNRFKLIYPLWNMMQSLRLKSRHKDSMESFISDLTQRKVNKWNERLETLNRNQSQVKIASAVQRELIEEIHNCLDTFDSEELENVIDKSLNARLPRSVICEALEFSSSTGNCGLFHKLTGSMKRSDAEFYNRNRIYFETLNLELDLRTNGDNFDELIERFAVIYKESILNETAMKQTMKFYAMMIQDCVDKRGESTTLRLKERIAQLCLNVRNHQLLFELWRKLFESFWYSDQQLASEMIVSHAPLRKILSKQSSILCFIYLRNNNTELVNRLIQIFLHFNMMKQVEVLVKILLDFECWRKNMDAVLQIVQLCLKLDIQLTIEENRKFLDLLLKRPHDETQKPEQKITIQKYQFKF